VSAGVKGCVVTVVLIVTFFPFVKNDKGHLPKHVDVESISHSRCAEDERWWPGVSVVWEEAEYAAITTLSAGPVTTKRATITFGRCVSKSHSLAFDNQWRVWSPMRLAGNAASAKRIALTAAGDG
jgi:hypothetical protein